MWKVRFSMELRCYGIVPEFHQEMWYCDHGLTITAFHIEPTHISNVVLHIEDSAHEKGTKINLPPSFQIFKGMVPLQINSYPLKFGWSIIQIHCSELDTHFNGKCKMCWWISKHFHGHCPISYLSAYKPSLCVMKTCTQIFMQGVHKQDILQSFS